MTKIKCPKCKKNIYINIKNILYEHKNCTFIKLINKQFFVII
jgi:phage FluMu protein Com